MSYPKHALFLHWEQKQAIQCKAFGYPGRLRIPDLIHQKGNRLHLDEISRNLPLSRQAVSDHVQVLHRAGFVDVEEVGRYNYYSLNRQSLGRYQRDMNAYLDALLKEVMVE